MKNNNIVKIIIAALVIALIAYSVFSIINNNNKEEYDIVKIEYSYGGGYGTRIDTASKYITFTSDGNVTFTNGYDDSTKSYNNGVEKYNELCNYINDRSRLFTKGVSEDKDVLDGGSSHIEIVLKDGTSHKIGGYMVSDTKYKEIVHKINELINKEELLNYVENIGK